MERGGGALTSNAVLIMLFDATCCLHSLLLFTRVSRGLASLQYSSIGTDNC